ncbi:aspartate-semialdehyde dehydrogenase [Porphyrobacter sp. CACIAM 03H1]|uniref:aspartate-semialdehyde dehydrogenase n=1 Tax=Porphyrobacter sp. CACIAM 03H1 TaxID=2003315 RepID=UPI000B5A5A46|nr:aspartate-semialdehyde dehydrogenase [Porphyrobacter sp. CACIAM 03H1]ASJ91534.1 aspartate-semialdehyde dehydrogenase [Porphyrobacter sp. CACIAM 03H1]
MPVRPSLLVLAGALALAGCDSGEVPSPAERQQGDAPAAPVSATRVELRSEGLAAGGEAFYFAAGKAEVEAALTRVLGPVLRTGENAECGAGPVVFTDFAGGLTVHFQDDRFVGWNWRAPQDGDAPATGTVTLPGKVQLGTARAVVEAAPGFARVEGSTLGEEFALGGEIGGFIAGDKVDMLYAGTQCFFR